MQKDYVVELVYIIKTDAPSKALTIALEQEPDMVKIQECIELKAED